MHSTRLLGNYALWLGELKYVWEDAFHLNNITHLCIIFVLCLESICGGEAGVDAADILSERLMVRTNGAQGVFANRRDKKVQQELIKAAGLRSVRQAAGKQFSDVESFLKNEQYPVVLKPTDSAGSDGVKLCHSFEEAKEHFSYLFQVEAVNGGV